MDAEIIEKYKRQMLEMYRKQSGEKVKTTVSEEAQIPSSSSGNLLAEVTTVRTLYPVPNAKVTIFTGDYNNMKEIDSAFTDISGKTRVFSLPTPEKALSLESGNKGIPYAIYNMLVEADGYVPNVHLNVPVFSGVTSIQGSNLILKETAGANMDVRMFDEAQKYDL